MNRKKIEYFSGCIIGGACGDALGSAVEFISLETIRQKYGPKGIAEFDRAFGQRGAITDDTQMTLFTAEGLILSSLRGKGQYDSLIPEYIYPAYLRWLSTQGEVHSSRLIKTYGTCSIIDGRLTTVKALHSRRAPGNSCISALKSVKMGSINDPVNNSKGCGGVMRVAPIGLFTKPESAFQIACEAAAITHGHPTGFLAAGCLACIISAIILGKDLMTAIRESIKTLKSQKHHSECLVALTRAVDAFENKPLSSDTVEELGAGWIAEEALSIGVYSAMAAGNDFEKGLSLSVNHSGDSDSTGSIAGNIMGAVLGVRAIPSKYLNHLELIDLIQEVSIDLFERTKL